MALSLPPRLSLARAALRLWCVTASLAGQGFGGARVPHTELGTGQRAVLYGGQQHIPRDLFWRHVQLRRRRQRVDRQDVGPLAGARLDADVVRAVEERDSAFVAPAVRLLPQDARTHRQEVVPLAANPPSEPAHQKAYAGMGVCRSTRT